MQYIRISKTNEPAWDGQPSEQREYLFENGNAVSVIRSPMSYGYSERLFEAMYINDEHTVGDPSGWLTIMGLVEFLRRARNFTLEQQAILDEEEALYGEPSYETDRSALDALHGV